MSHTLKDVCIKFEEAIKGQMLIGTFAEGVVPTKGLFKLTFTRGAGLVRWLLSLEPRK